MPILDNLISQLLEGCSNPEDIPGESGLLKQLTKVSPSASSARKWTSTSGMPSKQMIAIAPSNQDG